MDLIKSTDDLIIEPLDNDGYDDIPMDTQWNATQVPLKEEASHSPTGPQLSLGQQGTTGSNTGNRVDDGDDVRGGGDALEGAHISPAMVAIPMMEPVPILHDEVFTTAQRRKSRPHAVVDDGPDFIPSSRVMSNPRFAPVTRKASRATIVAHYAGGEHHHSGGGGGGGGDANHLHVPVARKPSRLGDLRGDEAVDEFRSPNRLQLSVNGLPVMLNDIPEVFGGAAAVGGDGDSNEDEEEEEQRDHDRDFTAKTFDEFGEGNFVVITTTRKGEHFHWYRKPYLRQEWLDEDRTILRREKDLRRAGFMELYYDLIFVAVIALVGHETRFEQTFSYSFFLELVALINIWFKATMYYDRFDSEDGLHKGIYLFLMAGVVGMGIGGNYHSLSTGAYLANVHRAWLLSYLWSRCWIDFLYIGCLSIPDAVSHVLFHLCCGIPSVALWIAAVAVPDERTRLILVSIALAWDVAVPPLIVRLIPNEWAIMIPINLEHVVERVGIFGIVIIGETIVAILFIQDRNALEAAPWGSAGLGLMLSFFVQWLYYDIDNGKHSGLTQVRHALRRGGWWAYTWIISHYPLFISIIIMSAGVWNVGHNYVVLELEALPSTRAGESTSGSNSSNATVYCGNYSSNSTTNGTKYPAARASASASGDPFFDICNPDPFFYGRWVLCAGAAGVLFWITVNGIMHKRSDSMTHVPIAARLAIRLVCVVTIATIPLAGPLLTPMQYLGIIVALFGLTVLVALEHKHRTHKNKEMIKEKISQLRLSRQRAPLTKVPSSPHRTAPDGGAAEMDSSAEFQGMRPQRSVAFIQKLADAGKLDLDMYASIDITGSIPNIVVQEHGGGGGGLPQHGNETLREGDWE